MALVGLLASPLVWVLLLGALVALVEAVRRPYPRPYRKNRTPR